MCTNLTPGPMASLRRVYAELGLQWTLEFESRTLDYLHSVRDYRAATMPKSARAADAGDPELVALAREFGHDRAVVENRELPHRAAAPARSARGMGAATGVALLCFVGWLVQAWFLRDRHDWLAWPAGVLIGLTAIRLAKVGSVRLGLVAAGLTVAVFAVASVPATFLSDYAHRTSPPFHVGYRPLPPMRQWEWYHILKASRAGGVARDEQPVLALHGGGVGIPVCEPAARAPAGDPLGSGMAKDPDILVDLVTCRNSFEAQVIAEALKAQGLPAYAFDIAGSTLQWDVAVSQPIRVAVRRADLETARGILRAVKADSVDLDWSEVQTGDPTPVTPEEVEASRRAPESRAEVISRGRRAGMVALIGFGVLLAVLLVVLLGGR
jgi:hypothetical protein